MPSSPSHLSLAQIAHRPYPPERGRWVMEQTWSDLLFAHWRVPADRLRASLPKELDIDLFRGDAWIAVVPFRMSGVRLRGLPRVPGTHAFLELNVRTYVSYRGRPGVYFFSLDASNGLAVRVARTWYRLPYFSARMAIEESSGWIRYTSERTHGGAPPAAFDGRYRPAGPVLFSAPGSLEAFLTERYRLLTVHRGRVYSGEIHHAPWPLQRAEAEIDRYTMTESLGLPLEGAPLLHFARSIDTIEWPIVPV